VIGRGRAVADFERFAVTGRGGVVPLADDPHRVSRGFRNRVSVCSSGRTRTSRSALARVLITRRPRVADHEVAPHLTVG
jgi:hypothetical protein